MNEHGVYSIQDLRGEGFSRRKIDRLVSVGELRRLSRGWYARPDADPDVALALIHRGRIGCLTGCGLYGVWVPADKRLHILAGAKRRPSLPPEAWWHPWDGAQPRTPVFSLEDCLAQVIHRHDVESALICLESATNRSLIEEGTARRLIKETPTKRCAGLSYFDPRAESGTETRVRLLLQHRHVPVRCQVAIDGLGRVDLIAGESLIIECDSTRYHTAEENYERDRRRDLIAMHTGLRTLRLTYSQVFHTWEHTKSVLSDLLKSRVHRRRPRPAA